VIPIPPDRGTSRAAEPALSPWSIRGGRRWLTNRNRGDRTANLDVAPRELVPEGNKLYGTMPRVYPTGEVQSSSTDAGSGNGDPHILRTQGERLALDQPQVSRTKQIG